MSISPESLIHHVNTPADFIPVDCRQLEIKKFLL